MSLPDTPSAPPNAQVPKRKKSRLTLYIGIAIVAAVGLAVTAPQVAVQFELGGEIFLRLLLMMVVPLVVASVMSSIIGLGDIRKLGRPGGFAIAYYLTTTVMAVIVGLIMVNVIQPGIGAIDADTLETMAAQGQEITAGREDEGLGSILSNLALMLFTDNLFLAAAESSLLPLIFFSIIFAGMLTSIEELPLTFTHNSGLDLGARGSEVSLGRFLQDQLVQCQVRHCSLQAPVLALELLQAPCLAHLHPAVLPPPPVVRLLGDAELPAHQLHGFAAGQTDLCLPQCSDDLLRSVSLPSHQGECKGGGGGGGGGGAAYRDAS